MRGNTCKSNKNKEFKFCKKKFNEMNKLWLVFY